VRDRGDRRRGAAAFSSPGDDFPGRGTTCTFLEIMAAEEMAKVWTVLGTEVPKEGVTRSQFIRRLVEQALKTKKGK
jgi:hypothetical protein